MLAGQLPLPIPEPVALGRPAAGFPWPWSVYRWIEGEPACRGQIADLAAFAADLAGFLAALYGIDASDGPPPALHSAFRGGSLTTWNEQTRTAIDLLAQDIDARAAIGVWETALASPWQQPPVWVHGDVSASNLLLNGGALHAVIDFGCAAVGDPACDLVMAWTFFPGPAAAVFRRGALAVADLPRLTGSDLLAAEHPSSTSGLPVKLSHPRSVAGRDGAARGNPLRHPAAARSIGSYRRKAKRSDVTVTTAPPGGRPGGRRPGVRRRAAALVGLPAGHGHYPRRRAGDEQPDVPGAPWAAAMRDTNQRVPVRRRSPRRAPDPAAAAAGRARLPGTRAGGRSRRADGDRDQGRARRRLPVAARRTPWHRRRGGVRAPNGISHGVGLYVLTLADDRICARTRFDNSVLPWFGLPRSLPSR